MMGTKTRRFAPLPPVSWEDLVPSDHVSRHLERVLDLGFVRELVRDAYAEIGRPSIDPVVFFKLQLVLFFEGLRSERQLLRVVADRLSLRSLSRLRPDRAAPPPFQPDPHSGAVWAGGLPPLLRGGRGAVPDCGIGLGAGGVPRCHHSRGQCVPRFPPPPLRRGGASGPPLRCGRGR
jgi:hypothetical protein